MFPEAKAALARRCRQFSSSLMRLTTSGADVCALTLGIQSNFNLLDVSGDGGFTLDSWMDDLRNDACQWILVRHEWIINRKFFNLESCKSFEGHGGVSND
jgi:hypothetical protein